MSFRASFTRLLWGRSRILPTDDGDVTFLERLTTNEELWHELEQVLEPVRDASKHDYSQPEPRYVLLMRQVLIGSHQDIKLGLGGPQQSAVLYSVPPTIMNGFDVMLGKMSTEPPRNRLIEEQAHLCSGTRRRGQARLRPVLGGPRGSR